MPKLVTSSSYQKSIFRLDLCSHHGTLFQLHHLQMTCAIQVFSPPYEEVTSQIWIFLSKCKNSSTHFSQMKTFRLKIREKYSKRGCPKKTDPLKMLGEGVFAFISSRNQE